MHIWVLVLLRILSRIIIVLLFVRALHGHPKNIFSCAEEKFLLTTYLILFLRLRRFSVVLVDKLINNLVKLSETYAIPEAAILF